MVSKKSIYRTMAGVLPDRSRFFNVAFPAAGATYDAGAIWPFSSIMRGLQKRCRNVEELRGDPTKNRRALGATDKISDLKFVAIMTHVNGRPDDIAEMLYVSVFGGVGMTDERAEEIDRHLDVTLAYAEDGDLYLVASPKIVDEFDDAFFNDQLTLFLDDIRNAMRLVLDDGDMRSAAVREIKSMMAGTDPGLSGVRNRLDGNRFHAEAVSIFSPRVDCETCGGKGKRFLRTCPDCSGRGYRR